MESKYLNQIETLLKQSHPALSRDHRVEFKNVFGAVGGYVDGRIFVSCGKFGIAFRLPPEMLAALFQEEAAERLRYFPKGHVKKEYAVLSERVLQDEQRLKKIVEASVKHALSS